jgi:hypothetical protein
MKDHFKLLQDFELRINDVNEFGNQSLMLSSYIGKNENDLKLLTAMLIHAADFNGVVKKFPLSKQWSAKVNQEFI